MIIMIIIVTLHAFCFFFFFCVSAKKKNVKLRSVVKSVQLSDFDPPVELGNSGPKVYDDDDESCPSHH